MDVARDDDVGFARGTAQQMAHCFGVDASYTFSVDIDYFVADLEFAVPVKANEPIGYPSIRP